MLARSEKKKNEKLHTFKFKKGLRVRTNQSGLVSPNVKARVFSSSGGAVGVHKNQGVIHVISPFNLLV
jgi:hypothetical protein